MGERRGDGMTAFKTVMNNYQSFLETNTKTESNWRSEDINLSFVMIIEMTSWEYFENKWFSMKLKYIRKYHRAERLLTCECINKTIFLHSNESLRFEAIFVTWDTMSLFTFTPQLSNVVSFSKQIWSVAF
jgi:hypothetical protein